MTLGRILRLNASLLKLGCGTNMPRHKDRAPGIHDPPATGAQRCESVRVSIMALPREPNKSCCRGLNNCKYHGPVFRLWHQQLQILLKLYLQITSAYTVIKQCTRSHIQDPCIMEGTLLNSGVLGSLGRCSTLLWLPISRS